MAKQTINEFIIDHDEIDVAKQYEQMSYVRNLNQNIHNGSPLCYIETFGCQQNEADSEIIRGMTTEMGYKNAKCAQEADLIIFNTCAIRENAENRTYGNIGSVLKYKRQNPELIIAVCGCMAGQKHTAEKIKKSYPDVSLVVDTHALYLFPELLAKALMDNSRSFASGNEKGSIVEGMPKEREHNVKAWLSIMYGCNNFCSYCVVPYVRGRERSRSVDDILAEAKTIIQSDRKEITLLGQNVNSYRGNTKGFGFSDLLREVNSLPGEFLIRFMSSHPKDASHELFEVMAECEKVAPLLHLPFQSGSDAVLKRMNRGYTAGYYRELINAAREAIPNLTVTSDVIVGFPGESEKDFLDTMKLVEELEFDSLFTFIYSPRKGTAAEKMIDTTPVSEKSRRFSELLELQNSISHKKHSLLVGSTQRVLVDGRATEKPGYLTSRTPGGRLVIFEGKDESIGHFINVEIVNNSTWSFIGRLPIKRTN